MRVLIADDDRMVASVLAEMVRNHGHEVTGIARSGLEAIRFYNQSAPDVVLMDFAMSTLNGATASRMIMSQHPEARIVMVSGYLSREDLSQMECGAMVGIPKPLRVERLNTILDEMERRIGKIRHDVN